MLRGTEYRSVVSSVDVELPELTEFADAIANERGGYDKIVRRDDDMLEEAVRRSLVRDKNMNPEGLEFIDDILWPGMHHESDDVVVTITFEDSIPVYFERDVNVEDPDVDALDEKLTEAFGDSFLNRYTELYDVDIYD